MASDDLKAKEERLTVPRCTATSKSSGVRCGQPAIPGGSVCIFHGGSAPQVRESARRRLLALVDPALLRLETLVRNSQVDAAALGAAKDILDRAGLKEPEEIRLTTTKGDEDLSVLTEEELATLIQLRTKLAEAAELRQNQAEVADGETTDSGM